MGPSSLPSALALVVPHPIQVKVMGKDKLWQFKFVGADERVKMLDALEEDSLLKQYRGQSEPALDLIGKGAMQYVQSMEVVDVPGRKNNIHLSSSNQTSATRTN